MRRTSMMSRGWVSAAVALGLAAGCAGDASPTPTDPPQATPTATAAPEEILSLSLSLAGGPFTAGKAYSWRATVTSSTRGDVTAQAAVRLRVAPATGAEILADTVTLTKAGAYTLTAEASLSGESLSQAEARDVVAAAPVAVALSLSSPAPRAGTAVTVRGDLVDPFGNVAFADPLLALSVDPEEGVSIDGSTFAGTVAGAYTLSAMNAATGLSGGAAFEIVPNKAVSLKLDLSGDRAAPGEAVTFEAVTEDAYGNPTGGDPTVTTSPSNGVRVTGSRLLFSQEGVFDVRATWAAEDRDLTATAGPVTVDGTAPTLTISTPARASWTDSTTVLVRGQAADALAGLSGVTLGGEEIPIDGHGNFSTTTRALPGLNVLELAATDLNGNHRQILQTYIYAAESAPPESRVSDAFYGRMGLQTIDELARLLEAELDVEEISAWAVSNNPIEAYYDSYTGPFGNEVVTSAYINVVELRYKSADVVLTPHGDSGSGYLDLSVVFDDLGVTLEAFGELANIDYSICGDLDTSEAVATARVKAAFNADGTSRVTLSNVIVKLNGFDMEMCSDQLDLLMEAIEENTQEELESTLTDLIKEDIPAELEALLDSLTLSETFEFEGAELLLSAGLQGMDFDDAGARLWMWSQLGAEIAPGMDVGPGAPVSPSIPPTYPPDYTLYVSANDDLLNQLLYTMWIAGTLNLKYSAADLGLSPEQIALLFNGATEVQFALAPALPPVLMPSFAPGYLMDAGLGDCFIYVLSDATTHDPEELALDYALAATLIAPADAAAPLPDLLRITFGPPHTLSVQILQAVEGAQLTEEALNLVLDAASDELIAFLNDSLSEIPIPTVEGYSLYAYDFYMDGPQGDFLTIAGDLVPPTE